MNTKSTSIMTAYSNLPKFEFRYYLSITTTHFNDLGFETCILNDFEKFSQVNQPPRLIVLGFMKE